MTRRRTQIRLVERQTLDRMVAGSNLARGELLCP